jgi:hypothetical protein
VSAVKLAHVACGDPAGHISHQAEVSHLGTCIENLALLINSGGRW